MGSTISKGVIFLEYNFLKLLFGELSWPFGQGFSVHRHVFTRGIMLHHANCRGSTIWSLACVPHTELIADFTRSECWPSLGHRGFLPIHVYLLFGLCL